MVKQLEDENMNFMSDWSDKIVKEQMDKKEFERKLQDIAHDYTVKKNALCREFALSHNTVNPGDIITDHIGSIRVANIRFYISPSSSSSGLPMCVYRGPMYTKAKKPFRSGKNRDVYQENVKDIIAKEL